MRWLGLEGTLKIPNSNPWCQALSPGVPLMVPGFVPTVRSSVSGASRAFFWWLGVKSSQGVKSEQNSPCSRSQHFPWQCDTRVASGQQILANRASWCPSGTREGLGSTALGAGLCKEPGEGSGEGSAALIHSSHREEPKGSLEMQTHPRASRVECPLLVWVMP